MSTTKFELSTRPSNYAGSLAGLNLGSRWDLNATQTGKFLLNPYTGSKHDTGVQTSYTKIINVSQTGANQAGLRALNTVFISPVVASGTTLQNVFSGQFQASKANTSADFVTYGYLSVMDVNGNLKEVVGTFSGSSLYPTNTLTNRTLPQGTPATGLYVFASGERLVVEVGAVINNSSSGAHKFMQKFGYLYTGDLPVDNTDTSNKNPWMFFSNTINF